MSCDRGLHVTDAEWDALVAAVAHYEAELDTYDNDAADRRELAALTRVLVKIRKAAKR